ncbi:hydrolase [Inmirania thermothiophila]|uniref:Nicotinamidase-related amidase n=1 Tax=Inmirania thermothiophila TaxID=1750597 RepID=A0A3N1Y1M6_9GAMM|nr:hydrolase [Inmirania thermothiophila]ROR32428.1 nicotinamidase-related amidase [Inmirania thermothiophila]
MLLDARRSLLLVVDVQERLLPAIHEGAAVEAACRWLVGLAGELAVPVLASEQYPKGLGRTVASLRASIPAEAFMEKVHFSCAAAPQCAPRIEASGRDQVVIAGIEAHVCVLQTALGLLGQGREVYVVADAVGSRAVQNRDLGLARMRQEGVRVVSREMVAFEWLREAGTERFRRISREYLR